MKYLYCHKFETELLLITGEGGGQLNISVVHMGDQRNAKKGLFVRVKRDLRESRLGVKIFLFWRKRVLYDFVKGRFGSKIARNSRLGCLFPGEGKSRLG